MLFTIMSREEKQTILMTVSCYPIKQVIITNIFTRKRNEKKRGAKRVLTTKHFFRISMRLTEKY